MQTRTGRAVHKRNSSQNMPIWEHKRNSSIILSEIARLQKYEQDKSKNTKKIGGRIYERR